MLRGMIFIDHMNFHIALQNYYMKLNGHTPKLDYSKVYKELVKLIPGVDFLKAFIFIPKPDEFLMKNKKLNDYYNWVTGMKNAPFTDVIEGSYVARPVDDNKPMNINDKTSY